MMRIVWLLCLLSMALLASVLVAAEQLRIDDLTVLVPATDRVRAEPLPSEDPTVTNAGHTTPVTDYEVPRSLEEGFVGCSTSNNCYPFHLTTYIPGTAVDLLPEGSYPYDATMTPDGSEVWIPGAAGDGLVVIDRATDSVAHRMPVADYVISVAFSNDGSLALVSSRGDENLTLIDTETYQILDTLTIPTSYLGAGNIALDPVSGNFYLVDWFGDDFYEIAPDGLAVLTHVVDLGASLWQLVVAPDGQYIYVTDRSSDQVRVIDQATLNQVTAVGVGDDPWGIDITGDGSKLVVTCEDSHDVWIIDTSDWSTTIIPLDITADPRDVDILDQSQLAFVTGGRVGTTVHPVYVIDLTDDTLLTSFEGPGQNTNVIAVQPQMHATGTGVADGQLPAGSVNLVAYPNPFNPSTRITFTLGEDAAGELAVYDLAGRRVRLLAQGSWSAGAHVYRWDGRDDSGRRIGSGVYAVRLRAGEQRHGLKVVLTQ